MAITSSDASDANQPAATPAAPAPAPTSNMQFNQQPNQQATAPAADQRWSFHNSSFGRAPVGRNIGSEQLIKLQKAIEEIYKTADQRFEFTLIPVDNNVAVNLVYSALVVCVRDKAAKETGVAYYTMILESSGEKIPPRYETIGGQQIEILRVAGDAFDIVMMETIMKKVQAQFPNTRIFNADAMVIPASFNVEDTKAVHALAANAGLATYTEVMTKSVGFEDLNLATSKNDSNLQVALRYEKGIVEDAAGQPQRSDVKVLFSSQQNQQATNRSVNSGDRVTKVAELSGFVDVVWAPVQNNSGWAQYGQAQQNPMMNQKYAARLVLTKIEADYLATLPSYLLAIITSLAVRDDNNWYSLFKPSTSYGSDNMMHDVGALNFEANLLNEKPGHAERIDTRKESFSLPDLAQLLGALIRPGLIISMDVPDCGAQSWYLNVFAAASNGSREAQEVIFNAAQTLTNGRFGNYFNGSDRMFDDIGNRVHTGTYIGANGVKRDLRDIDYLAVLNLSNDMDVVREWSDTFTQVNTPIIQRLASRKRIITGIATTAEITGMATRVTFTEKLLAALQQGAADAGLMMNIDTPITGLGFQNNRGVASFVDTTLNSAGNSMVFGRGRVAGQTYQNQNSGFNRWS